jgi:hypothetical protein
VMRETMLRVLQAALVLALGVGAVIDAAARDRAGTEPGAVGCPQSAVQAGQRGVRDAEAFVKRFPAGIWSGFLSARKGELTECPALLRRAYLEAARSFIEKPHLPGAGRIKTRGEPVSERK